MSDLISRAKLFNDLATVQSLGEAYAVINGEPTVDAVEVIICDDCRYCYIDDKVGLPACALHKFFVDSTGFCSAALRRFDD